MIISGSAKTLQPLYSTPGNIPSKAETAGVPIE